MKHQFRVYAYVRGQDVERSFEQLSEAIVFYKMLDTPCPELYYDDDDNGISYRLEFTELGESK